MLYHIPALKFWNASVSHSSWRYCNRSLRFSSLVKMNQLASRGYTPPIQNAFCREIFQDLTHSYTHSTVCSSLFGEFWNSRVQIPRCIRHGQTPRRQDWEATCRGLGNLNASISQKPCNVLQPRLPKHQLLRQKKIKKNTVGHQAKGNIHVKALCISNRGPWPGFLLL